MIPFNKTSISGNEEKYMQDAIRRGRLSSGGHYNKTVEHFLADHFETPKALLTSSASSALEICALLLDLQEGDEVIVPSFTFITTATTFSIHGATIRFADIDPKTLNVSAETIAPLINKNTKAICVVHYAGVACKMDEIMALASANNLMVIEDSALGFDAYYKHKPLGSIGDLGVFSFHETKNISCGEGGALLINNESLLQRAQIIRDKGSNRNDFEQQLTDKYECVDLGSSYGLSELNAAFLLAQLENKDIIKEKRLNLWNKYKNDLSPLELEGKINLPFIPGNCDINGSLFYLLCEDLEERTNLMEFLKQEEIKAVFHYQPLHSSPYYTKLNQGVELPVTSSYASSLLRLPLYNDLSENEQEKIIQAIFRFYA